MSIERDSQIVFDPDGTLRATTSWISKHDEGLAELLKNVHYAYLPNRANVDIKHHAAAVLLVDGDGSAPARIGVLDVGGATLDDLERWSVWQDQGASLVEGVTQGNGGKAYLFRMFSGEARLLGVREGKRSCKGFEGALGSKERGTPGFMPNVASGRQAPVSALLAELDDVLKPYRLSHTNLPRPLLSAIRQRDAFTIAEGLAPKDVWRGRIQAEDLIQGTLLHEQASIVIEQIRVYAIHNGATLNAGKPLELDAIAPFPGFETARIFEIPEQLRDQDGSLQSTTLERQRPHGRLILQTSKDNMDTNWRRLRPRWKITYRTHPQHPIGSKRVAELIPTTPGSAYVYATVDLPALDPDYVVVGRLRPNDGPLMRALDRFVAERLRELATEINATRRHELDQKGLEAVQRENQRLDQWKNQFLPTGGEAGQGGIDGNGPGGKHTRVRPPTKYGDIPAAIDIEHANDTLKVGRSVALPVDWFLKPFVRDKDNLPIRNPDLIWISDDPHVVDFPNPKEGRFVAKSKGHCSIRLKLKGTSMESDPVHIEVWVVDHVLLTPRSLRIPLGERERLTAEVTNDDGQRSTEVLLNWEHDADDPLIVRIRPTGTVTGNRIGRTTISAGAGDPKAGGVWARVRAEIEIVENPDLDRQGGGFPTLKVTDKDTDPETGEKRESDPDEPPLWQGVSDYKNNIWWLNLGSKEAEAAYSQKKENPRAWRLYHAQKVVEMVVHVHMQNEYTARAGGEVAGLWSDHWAAFNTLQKQYIPLMWEKLNEYVLSGSGLD
jgi:hypothetical protein